MLTGGAGIISAHFPQRDAKVQRGTVMYQRSHSQEVTMLGDDLGTQTRSSLAPIHNLPRVVVAFAGIVCS